MPVRTRPEREKLNSPILHFELVTRTLPPGKVTPGTIVQPEGGNGIPISTGAPVALSVNDRSLSL